MAPSMTRMLHMLILTTLLPFVAADGTGCTCDGCTAEDESRMNEMGGGNTGVTFPKLLSNCGKRSYDWWTGFDSEKFVKCLEDDISAECGKCFVEAAQFQALNCKWPCTAPWGKWCREDCLECFASETAEAQQCAGVAVPAAQPCT